MKKADVKKIQWFKAELKASLSSKPVRKKLEDQLEKLDNQFNAHSPSLTGMHSETPADRDHKLLIYTEKRSKIIGKLQVFKYQEQRVNDILALMPEEYVKICKELYSGRRTLDNLAMITNYSRNAVRWNIDKKILDAVKAYEKGD